MRNVAILVGSLRRDSENRRLACAIAALARNDFRCHEVDLNLPIYNDDLWVDPPASVLRMKDAVEATDAVLFITPEHNRSIPAALKNAIDWGSRPKGRNNWAGKPVGVIGGSISKLGAGIAQAHLRSVLVSQDCRLLGQPEVYFQFQDGWIDNDGTITDVPARLLLENYIFRFSKWIELLAGLSLASHLRP
jgi:chromate reductase